MNFGQKLICEGLKDYGLKEVHGVGSNPEILKMIQEVFSWAGDDSNISWCGIWLGRVFNRLGFSAPEKHAVARSWKKVGFSVPIDQIRQGDICVFWRHSPSDWRGHVGVYIGQDTPNYFLILGGNQSNQVGINAYSKDKLLDIRRIV